MRGSATRRSAMVAEPRPRSLAQVQHPRGGPRTAFCRTAATACGHLTRPIGADPQLDGAAAAIVAGRREVAAAGRRTATMPARIGLRPSRTKPAATEDLMRSGILPSGVRQALRGE